MPGRKNRARQGARVAEAGTIGSRADYWARQQTMLMVHAGSQARAVAGVQAVSATDAIGKEGMRASDAGRRGFVWVTAAAAVFGCFWLLLWPDPAHLQRRHPRANQRGSLGAWDAVAMATAWPWAGPELAVRCGALPAWTTPSSHTAPHHLGRPKRPAQRALPHHHPVAAGISSLVICHPTSPIQPAPPAQPDLLLLLPAPPWRPMRHPCFLAPCTSHCGTTQRHPPRFPLPVPDTR